MNLPERRQNLLVDYIEVLRAAIAKTRNKYPFGIDVIVVLPGHLHAVWTLPPGAAALRTRTTNYVFRPLATRKANGIRSPSAVL